MGGLFDPGKQFPRSVPGGWAGLVSAQGAQKRAAPLDLEQEDTAGLSQDQKKLRLQSSMRMLKDEPVPEGYSRFR